MDKRSFVCGMITAFSECVAGGCKRLALSPPMSHMDYLQFREELCGIIEKHGLIHCHEENLDLPEEERFEWILIAAKQETIDEYQSLRAAGYSPADSLAPFFSLLSYNPAESVDSGYDAFRAFFSPREKGTI